MTSSSGSSAAPSSSTVESADADQQQAPARSSRRGVLKKDSSYDDTLRPILKNNPSGYQSASESTSILQNSKLNDSSGALSSTSSEDLENFIDSNNCCFVGKIGLLFISQWV